MFLAFPLLFFVTNKAESTFFLKENSFFFFKKFGD